MAIHPRVWYPQYQARRLPPSATTAVINALALSQAPASPTGSTGLLGCLVQVTPSGEVA